LDIVNSPESYVDSSSSDGTTIPEYLPPRTKEKEIIQRNMEMSSSYFTLLQLVIAGNNEVTLLTEQ